MISCRYPEKGMITSAGENIVRELSQQTDGTAKRASLTICTIGSAEVLIDGDVRKTQKSYDGRYYFKLNIIIFCTFKFIFRWICN